MTFRPDGQLIYAIPTSGGQQLIRMTYRQEGSELITDQPSSPRLERTKFSFLDDNTLVLDYGGSRAEFMRLDD